MAGKPRNRMELRRQYEAAEPLDPMEDEADDTFEGAGDDDDEGEPRAKKKPKAAKAKAVKAPKAAKAPRASKSAKPSARMRIVWAVVNDAFKTIATFEFTQKDAALAKAEEMMQKGKGTHFVQKVKEPMPDDAPGLGASIPRSSVVAPKEVAKAVPLKPREADLEDEADDIDDDDDDFGDMDDDDE